MCSDAHSITLSIDLRKTSSNTVNWISLVLELMILSSTQVVSQLVQETCME